MPDEHMPGSIIVVYGPLGDIGRFWKCFRIEEITIYCNQEDCKECKIYEEIRIDEH